MKTQFSSEILKQDLKSHRSSLKKHGIHLSVQCSPCFHIHVSTPTKSFKLYANDTWFRLRYHLYYHRKGLDTLFFPKYTLIKRVGSYYCLMHDNILISIPLHQLNNKLTLTFDLPDSLTFSEVMPFPVTFFNYGTNVLN